MSAIRETIKTAIDEARAKPLEGVAIYKYVQKKLVESFGPLPIKCNAGWITDISQKSDGTPIFCIEDSPAVYERIPVERD